MIQENVEVLWNTKLSERYYRMGLTCDQTYKHAIPGQFVMVRMMDDSVPLLRRPFSIHRQVSEDRDIYGIEILYKVVGEVTQRLSTLTPGDVLDVLGPLGNGFTISKAFKRVYIVAGGIGVAPLLFLADALKASGATPSACHVFLGGRTKADLLCSDEFVKLDMAVSISTDDGSAGQTCLVTQPFEMATKREKPDIIYACGPENMLACVQDIARTYGAFCQVSVETLMACGIGACLGCAIETREDVDSYRRVCVDGPVFDASVLV